MFTKSKLYQLLYPWYVGCRVLCSTFKALDKLSRKYIKQLYMSFFISRDRKDNLLKNQKILRLLWIEHKAFRLSD